MASPAASKGVATTSPATGTTRATSAVTLNGSATAPHPARHVQISNRANTRTGCPQACRIGFTLERADLVSVPCRQRTALLAHWIVEGTLRLALLAPDIIAAIFTRHSVGQNPVGHSLGVARLRSQNTSPHSRVGRGRAARNGPAALSAP